MTRAVGQAASREASGSRSSTRTRAKASSTAKTSTRSRESPAPEEGAPALPEFDAASVGRIAKRVEILAVDLVGAYFSRRDDSALPDSLPDERPEIGIGPEWQIAPDGSMLGCAITFSTLFDGEPPYNITARFRLLYSLKPGDPPDPEDVAVFVFWNAVFNAWPYWREYVSSTVNRAHLPSFVVPVMPLPR